MSGPAGEKPTEFWQLEFRNIKDALDRNLREMCNAIKTSNPEVIEMSRRQHIETMAKIDELVTALMVTMKVLYIAGAVMTALGVIMIGVVVLCFFLLR
jgi:hypothetical protein